MPSGAQVLICSAVSLVLATLTVHNAILTTRVFQLESMVANVTASLRTLSTLQSHYSNETVPAHGASSLKQGHVETGSTPSVTAAQPCVSDEMEKQSRVTVVTRRRV